jgi:hypothetical protein
MSERITLNPDEPQMLAAFHRWAVQMPVQDHTVNTIEVRGPHGLVIQVDRHTGVLDYQRPDTPEVPF